MSHFPDVDRIDAVMRAWPRLFAQAPVGMQPLMVEDRTLIVLCQAPNLVTYVSEREEAMVRHLNELLDGSVEISSIRAVPATVTEMYLAREVFALRLWLRDFDIGF